MYSFGIDIGGSFIKIGLVKQGKIIEKRMIPTVLSSEPKRIIVDAALLCRSMLKDLALDVSRLSFIGVGCPGVINLDNQRVLYACNLNFSDFDMVKNFQEYFEVRVFVENDANCAALGEHLFGASFGSVDSVTITIGTGIGAGVIINDRIYRGCNGAGSEIGHMVIEHNGRQCSCGRKGCFESYCSAESFFKISKEIISEYSNQRVFEFFSRNESERNDSSFDVADLSLRSISEGVFENMKESEEISSRIVEVYIGYFSLAIANIINIFQPRVLVLSGGFSENFKKYPLLFEQIKNKVANGIYTKGLSVLQTEMKVASLGEFAGILGSGSLGGLELQ